MLANVHRIAPYLLRQCSRQANATVCPAQHVRQLATSLVLQQTSTDSPVSPDWVTEDTKGRSTSNSTHAFDSLMRQHKNPRPKFENKLSPEEIWNSRENQSVRNLFPPRNAYSGRTVVVKRGDVTTALTRLKGILNLNAVRYTNVRDERHEKKGEKRNRLKSLRWRRRFAHEVRKKVQLVNEIRAHGA